MDFQRNVAVHGQAVGPDVHPVLLFFKAPGGGRQHEVDAHQHGVGDTAVDGEDVVAYAGERTHQWRKHLENKREGKGKCQERQVHNGTVPGYKGDFVQLQRDAGVHRDASEREVDVEGDGYRSQEQNDGRDYLLPAGIPSADALQECPANQI